MAFSQSPSVTIVGFLAETRISDVIVRPEVKIVAGKTSQKESWAPKVVGRTDLDSIYQVN